MKTYLKHQENFGGANNILVSVCAADGDIFSEGFFTTLEEVHNKLFFIPGVDRTQVKSLFSPSTRFVEIVEGGFAGGPVIPSDFKPNERGLNKVKGNIEKAGIVGSMVASDYSCSLLRASLLDINPQTGEKLDTLAIAKQLEEDLRTTYEKDGVSVHIIGFAKMVGDVANGAMGVVLFLLSPSLSQL